MDCEEAVYSEDYYDFIIEYNTFGTAFLLGECHQEIDIDYGISYVKREGAPELNVNNYTYTALPKCFALMDQSALNASGILKVQNQPTLALKGQGILMGFVDTGIDYQNPVFLSDEKTSRIYRIWDQTIRTGNRPDGFIYGTEYTRQQINDALAQADPLTVVPSVDENGHGTYMAGVAAGSPDYANDFSGAAPYADIAVVKLKPAKRYLKSFYFIPEKSEAYEENDIMTAISYLDKLALEINKPLVLCLGLGTSMGSHAGISPLSVYLNSISIKKNHAVIVATGNEANARHHFCGSLKEQGLSETVEISVGENVTGFTVELWAKAPEIYSVAVVSPTGEQIPRVPARQGNRQVYKFIFEETVVTIDYRIVGVRNGNQLIYICFDRPTRGLWDVVVSADNIVDGHYHMWLPLKSFLSGSVIFLRSNPDTTITDPSSAYVPLSVGAYDAESGSLYLDSGRGYTLSGDVKPDCVAPGVNVYGPGKHNQYMTFTGTSAAAAVAAGATALLMEWAVLRQYDTTVNTADIKNYILRGARRESSRLYPNVEWGYGELDIYEALNKLRVL